MRSRVVVAAAALLFAVLADGGGQVRQIVLPSQLYTVTATVMQKPGEPPRACAFMPLPEPPIGCGGPEIGDLNLLTLPGAQHYGNRVVATSVVRLVGTWDGHALDLTAPPAAAAGRDAAPVPQCVPVGQQLGSTQMPPLMNRVIADHALLEAHGVQPLEFGECGDSLFIVLPLADRATIDFLRARYGPIQVSGWLRPVS